MKPGILFGMATLLTFAVSLGCNQKAEVTPNAKKPAAARYHSVAVLPISGELRIKYQGEELPKTFLERDFPEELAREISKLHSAEPLKVISMTAVQEALKQRPELSTRNLASAVNAETVLVGKAVPETNEIAFQLIVAETGELLWGDSFLTREATGGFFVDRPRPHLQDQQHIVESLASQVVKKLTGEQPK